MSFPGFPPFLLIQVNPVHRDCMSDECPFSTRCANHKSAGDYRLEDGFTPEIFIDDPSGNFYCKTAKEIPHTELGNEFPNSYGNLNWGFVPIRDTK